MSKRKYSSILLTTLLCVGTLSVACKPKKSTPVSNSNDLSCFFGDDSTDKVSFLDTSFGTSGNVFLNYNNQASQYAGHALMSDCKLVVAIDRTGGNYALAKYKPNMVADDSFGTNGISLHSHSGAGISDVSVRGKISINKNDEIFVAIEETRTGQSRNYVVIKHKKDGSVDTSFGTNGTVSIDVSNSLSQDRIGGVIPLNNGKLLVFGQSSVLPGGRIATTRLNSDGSIDTSYGTNGFQLMTPAAASTAYSFITKNNKHYITGLATMPGRGNSCLVVALNPQGEVDTSFGTSGYLTADRDSTINEFDGCYSTKIDDDGNLITIGESGNAAIVVKASASGVLDTSFGTNGVASFSVSGAANYGREGAILDNGKIFVATGANGWQIDIGFGLLLSNGSLDTNFIPTLNDPDFSQPSPGTLVMNVGPNDYPQKGAVFTANGQTYTIFTTNANGFDEVIIKRLNIE